MSSRARHAAAVIALWCACAMTPVVAQEATTASPTEPAPAVPASAPATLDVVMQTTLGEIRIALETTRAPITTSNFLRYVDAKRFDDVSFYRAVKIGEDGKYGLVQGGLQGNRQKAFPPILHEMPRATGLSHVDGAISMARSDPGTAMGDFFIIVGDLVAMDGTPDGSDPGYAVFGRVTSGMDIVRSILELPRKAEAASEAMKGHMLAEPVRILTIRRQ